jgi:hypothetical protein
MPSWQQWIIKASLAVGLALVLGVGLPVALSHIHLAEDIRAQGTPIFWNSPWVARMSWTIVMLTVASLYVSSLCTGGVRAIVASLPVIFAGGLIYGFFSTPYLGGRMWLSTQLFGVPRLRRTPQDFMGPIAFMNSVETYLLLAAGAAVALLLLRFGLSNHRSAERGLQRVVKQSVAIAALATTMGLVATFAWVYFWLRVPGAFFSR